MNLEIAVKNLKLAGFSVHVFDTGAEAAEWLNQQVDGQEVHTQVHLCEPNALLRSKLMCERCTCGCTSTRVKH